MSCVQRLLAVADGALCLFIFFPLAILHWRGTWGLQDVYFYPSDEVISGWISLVYGTIGCIAMQLFQPCIFEYIPYEHKRTYWIASRFFLYLNGWFVMGYWRGTWNLVDHYLTVGWQNSIILYAFCQFITLITRTARNNVGIPFSISLDSQKDILKPDRLFSSPTSGKALFTFDVVFCQLVIVTSNILVWRGMWNIFDAFLFPEKHLASDGVSLIIGYVLCIQLFFLQWPAGITSGRLDNYPIIWKILFEDLIVLVTTWANLLIWRGGWDLCVHYFIPDPLIGGWICHWIGTIGLISLKCFNSVAINGMEKDGSWQNGDGIFPTSYLRILLKDQCLSSEAKDGEDQYMIRDAADCDDEIVTTCGTFSDDDDEMQYSVDDVATHGNGAISNGATSHESSKQYRPTSNGYTLLSNSIDGKTISLV